MPKPETREEILERIRLGEDSSFERSQSRIVRFDEQIVPDATVHDLEPARWQRLTTERTLDDEVTFLRIGGGRRRKRLKQAQQSGGLRPVLS